MMTNADAKAPTVAIHTQTTDPLSGHPFFGNVHESLTLPRLPAPPPLSAAANVAVLRALGQVPGKSGYSDARTLCADLVASNRLTSAALARAFGAMLFGGGQQEHIRRLSLVCMAHHPGVYVSFINDKTSGPGLMFPSITRDFLRRVCLIGHEECARLVLKHTSNDVLNGLAPSALRSGDAYTLLGEFLVALTLPSVQKEPNVAAAVRLLIRICCDDDYAAAAAVNPLHVTGPAALLSGAACSPLAILRQRDAKFDSPILVELEGLVAAAVARSLVREACGGGILPRPRGPPAKNKALRQSILASRTLSRRVVSELANLLRKSSDGKSALRVFHTTVLQPGVSWQAARNAMRVLDAYYHHGTTADAPAELSVMRQTVKHVPNAKQRHRVKPRLTKRAHALSALS